MQAAYEDPNVRLGTAIERLRAQWVAEFDVVLVDSRTGLTDASADDYPGVGSRVVDDDGHFVRVIVTLLDVPEPGSLLLGVGALAAIARGARLRTLAA